MYKTCSLADVECQDLFKKIWSAISIDMELPRSEKMVCVCVTVGALIRGKLKSRKHFNKFQRHFRMSRMSNILRSEKLYILNSKV